MSLRIFNYQQNPDGLDGHIEREDIRLEIKKATPAKLKYTGGVRIQEPEYEWPHPLSLKCVNYKDDANLEKLYVINNNMFCLLMQHSSSLDASLNKINM